MDTSFKLARDERNRKSVEAILNFDGTDFFFDAGFKMTLDLRIAEISEDCPHGYVYNFVLYAPDPKGDPIIRVLATDNAHAPVDKKHPHDHWHATKMNPAGLMPIGVMDGSYVEVVLIEEHLGKFMSEAEKILIHMGLSPHITSMTSNPRQRGSKNQGLEL